MHTLYTDGGSRGNPGPAAYGFLLFDAERKLVDQGGQYLGEATNNFAEYQGILAGMRCALAHQVSDLKCYLDSELIVMQANGAYQVKHPQLKPLYKELKELKQQIGKVKFVHIPRAENKQADAIVNELLDKEASSPQ